MMSGTSLDGVDAALVQFNSTSELTVCDTFFIPYPASLKANIAKLSQSNEPLVNNELASIETILDELYSSCALKLITQAGISPNSIIAIANHGQTIRHSPDSDPPFSLQLGNGQQIANLTGIKTICRFRQADLAAGGQGAPLMPAFHQALFTNSSASDNQDSNDKSALINIGGIANITLLSNDVLGYDTGPGNTLMNQWIAKHKGVAFDKNGDWAKSGRTIPLLLQTLISDPYFSTTAPKSTGTEYFNLEWLRAMSDASGIILNNYPANDVQATLLQLTSNSIAAELQAYNCTSVYVCGGGAQNKYLMQVLSEALNQPVAKTDAIGIPADWVEAVGFAWLGYCHLQRHASNLPSVTGAKQKVVLGESYLPIA